MWLGAIVFRGAEAQAVALRWVRRRPDRSVWSRIMHPTTQDQALKAAKWSGRQCVAACNHGDVSAGLAAENEHGAMGIADELLLRERIAGRGGQRDSLATRPRLRS